MPESKLKEKQRLKKSIKEKDNKIRLLEIVLKEIRKFKEQKNKKSEERELADMEKELS